MSIAKRFVALRRIRHAKAFAAAEDRTQDLRIMRPTRLPTAPPRHACWAESVEYEPSSLAGIVRRTCSDMRISNLVTSAMAAERQDLAGELVAGAGSP